MTEIKVACAQCGQHISCDESYYGLEVNCPKCGTPLQVPAASKKKARTRKQPAEPPANPQHANLTAEQFAILENSIKTTLSHVLIQDIALEHLGGTRYQAQIRMMTAQSTEQCTADVNFDGENFVWQIANQSERKSAEPKPKAAAWSGVITAIAILLAIAARNIDWGNLGEQVARVLPSESFSGEFRSPMTENRNDFFYGKEDKMIFKDGGIVIKDAALYDINGKYEAHGDFVIVIWTGGADYAKIKGSLHEEKYQKVGNDLVNLSDRNRRWYRVK